MDELEREWPVVEDRGIYIDLGRVAALLVDRLRTGDTMEFAAIFAAVETLLIEGPADVRDAVTFGQSRIGPPAASTLSVTIPSTIAGGR
jgi:hypothetical protein